MDEKIYNAMMKLCDELTNCAVEQLQDVDILSYGISYVDNWEYDKLTHGVITQLCVIAKFKHKIRSLRNYNMIVNEMKEGETE